MGALQLLCLILSLYMNGTFGQLSLPENKASDRTGLLPSTVSGKASNVLRDILNQESLVRFSMVQKIQNLFMEAIDNKNDRQIMKTKVSEVAKELQNLETRSQIMEDENVKLKEELKMVYRTVNENRNFTMEEIQRLNQTELISIKSKTVALQDENIELALKNADTQNQFDLLNKTINPKIQGLEEENIKLKKELKEVCGTVNDSKSMTMEEIQRLNQTEIFFLKKQTLALKEENHELALKNAVLQKQFVVLNKTIDVLYKELKDEFHEKMQELKTDITKNRNNTHTVKQMQNDFRKELETLKSNDKSTSEKIKNLNELQLISVKSHLQKMKELDDNIRNESLALKNNDRALTKEVDVLKYHMNEMNSTLQKSSLDILSGRLKTTEDMIRSFSFSVNETLDIVREDLNETRWRLSAVSLYLLKVPSSDCHSCWDILQKFPILNRRDGVYTISVASEVKSVYCDMSTGGGGWTAIQRRQDGSTDFYRTWRDYKEGFGDPYKNYWIGNDAIYELTKNKDQELRVELQSFDGAEAYAQYFTFYVGDEGSKYRLTVLGYSGTAGDSLYYHNGSRFSTKDQDNDNRSYDNCATRFHGAWWYRACHYSNLNGEYAQSDVTGDKYTSWLHWKNKYEALQKTLMMIRKNV